MLTLPLGAQETAMESKQYTQTKPRTYRVVTCFRLDIGQRGCHL